MTPQVPKPPNKWKEQPPGNNLKRLAKRNGPLKTLMRHTFIDQIIDDHQLLWYLASTAAEKEEVRRRMQREIARALAEFVGIEVSLHGIVTISMGDFTTGGGLLLLGAAIVHALGRGGGG